MELNPDGKPEPGGDDIESMRENMIPWDRFAIHNDTKATDMVNHIAEKVLENPEAKLKNVWDVVDIHPTTKTEDRLVCTTQQKKYAEMIALCLNENWRQFLGQTLTGQLPQEFLENIAQKEAAKVKAGEPSDLLDTIKKIMQHAEQAKPENTKFDMGMSNHRNDFFQAMDDLDKENDATP